MLNENVAWPVSCHSIGTHIFGCRQEPKCVDDSHIKDSEIRTYDQIELRSASMLPEWQRKDNWTQCMSVEWVWKRNDKRRCIHYSKRTLSLAAEMTSGIVCNLRIVIITVYTNIQISPIVGGKNCLKMISELFSHIMFANFTIQYT